VENGRRATGTRGAVLRVGSAGRLFDSPRILTLDREQLMSIEDGVLAELERVTGTDQVRRDPDIALFDEDLLDSLGSVQLMVGLSERFAVEITPASVERSAWATPRLIIADIRRRTGA